MKCMVLKNCKTDEYFFPNCSADILSHKIVVKGNCTACGKTLGENDGLFLCMECQKKNNEKTR